MLALYSFVLLTSHPFIPVPEERVGDKVKFHSRKHPLCYTTIKIFKKEKTKKTQNLEILKKETHSVEREETIR